MKTSSFKAALIAWCISAAFTSCTKDKKLTTAKPQTQSSVQSLGINDFRPYTGSPMDLLSFAEDQDYERVDMARYALGNALKQFIDIDIANYIYQNAPNNEYSSVALDDVFAEFPDLLNDLNDYLANNPIAEMPYDFSSYELIKVALHKDGIDYDVEIFLPGLDDGAAFTGLPILSPGVEAQEETINGDQVFAWALSSGEAAHPILLDQSEMLSSEMPLMSLSLFNMGKRTANHAQLKITNHNPHPWGNSLDQWIAIDRIRIYKRFDKSAQAEVYYSGLFTDDFNIASTSSHWADMDNHSSDKLLRKIHRNSIGDWVLPHPNVHGNPTWHALAPFLPSPWNITDKIGTEVSCVWNLFEKDWWEGKKAIGYASSNPATRKPTGHMTFYDETYLYHPSSCNRASAWCIDENSSDAIWNANGARVFATGHWQAEVEFVRVTQ